MAEWLASVIMTGEAALGIGYSGVGRLGELWIDVRLATPRALAAAGGTALLWLALGSAATRRWMWGLAGLFAVFGLVNRQFHPAAGVIPDPVSRAMDIAVYCLLPTLGCVAAVWLLGRFAPATGDVTPVTASTDVTARGHSRALLIVSSILMLLAGAFIGMWITSSVQIQQMSGWMVAAMDSARRSQYAFTQYREADYDEAKAALEQFAAYLESLKPASREWQPGEAPLSDEMGLAFDRMLTYGRLAVRAERASSGRTGSEGRVLYAARGLRSEPAVVIGKSIRHRDAALSVPPTEPIAHPPSRVGSRTQALAANSQRSDQRSDHWPVKHRGNRVPDKVGEVPSDG